jgi:ABC-type polysaccharide/polyol phosphate export permease
MFAQLSTIWRYRYFWTSLVSMDLRVRYRRSVLGIGWSLLNPILMTVVFCLVFAKGRFMPVGSSWETYAPHVLGGLAIWDFVMACALGGCQTFFRNECYIRQCPLPLVIYHLRTVLGAGIHFLIAIGVTVVAASVLHPVDSTRALGVLWAVIPSLLLLFLFCLSLSILCGYMTVFFQDTQQLLEVLFRLFFFLTPIMYYPQFLVDSGQRWLLSINPVATFFELVRDPLLTGQLASAWVFLKASIIVLIVMGLAISVVAKLEKKLIFHL